jgi:hypothetical protein
MPSTSVTFDWGLYAAVGQEAASERRDALAKECPLIGHQEQVRGKGKPKWEGGQNFTVALSMVQHTGITQFLDGYEEYDNAANEPDRVAAYPLVMSGLLMKIGGLERYTYGATPGGMRKKIESLTVNCMGFLKRGWEARIIGGVGTGFTSWIGFNGFDSTAGIFERSAVGSQSNTIGGLSKSTYANVIGWNNCVVNLNNAFGTNQIGLYQLIAQTKIHKDGGKKAWFFSTQGVTNVKRVVQAYERYMPNDKLDLGRPVMQYQGHPVYQESFMPVSTATGGSTTNTYPITAYFIDFEDIFFSWGEAQKGEGSPLPDGYFGIGEWGPIAGNTTVIGCPMAVVGQTIVADMGSSGCAYGGETY